MIDKSAAKHLYATMWKIRWLEEALQVLCDQGHAGDLHFSRGQESIATAVCAAMSPQDSFVTHHRTIAHQIAAGAELGPLVAEILGRTTGVNGGLAGEMQISDPKIGHRFSFQIVGTAIPVAAGMAWAEKYTRHTNGVVAAFFGDAAMSNGQFHEGVNIAVTKKVPLLLVCENNGRAGNIEQSYYDAGDMGARGRASAFGIPIFTREGRDVRRVYDVAAAALNVARESQSPVMLELMVERLCKHKQGQGDARSVEDFEKAVRMDPLREPDALQFKKDNPALEIGWKKLMQWAIQQALASPVAQPKSALA